MGRNPKQGIDYFPADVDMFQDRKIKRLLRSAGGKGFTIYIYLLTDIYRDKGYYYEWDEHSAFDISDVLNLSESVVEETVKACCSIGLFNESLFTEESIISSESIQNRWKRIVRDAGRTITDIDPKIKIEDGKRLFQGDKSDKPPEKPDKPPEKHHKEKKRKVKESKEDKYTGDFEDFWETYGVKKGKKKAYQEWKRLTEQEKAEIMFNVPIFLTHFSSEQYTPRPRKYLHNRYWEDEGYQQPRQKENTNGSQSTRPTKGDRRIAQLKEHAGG